MKKLGLAILSIAIIASIYYFSKGSEQLKAEMKIQVNNELASLQTQGFSVQNREISEKKEHFVLSFDEPEKITTFIQDKGTQLDAQEVAALKGLKIGFDVNYLADAYSAVHIDMYPVVLPDALTEPTLREEDKKVVAQLKKILEKKGLLIHMAVNKLGTGFKGYMKDIDEVIQADEDLHVVMHGLTFTGDIKDDQIAAVKQTLKGFTLNVDNELNMSLSNLASHYSLTGQSAYDYSTGYTVEKVLLDNRSAITVLIEDLDVVSDSFAKDGLASGSLQTKAKKINITEHQQNTILQSLTFNMKASNFDIKAFEQLGKVNINNDQEMYAVLQQLISRGIELDISNFSIGKITADGQTIDGFSMSTALKVDKSLNITALQQNPMLAISAINANLDLALSQGLFGMIAKHPQAVMAMMLFQPKDVNNQKVYKIELQDGSLSVNGQKAL